MKVKTEIKNEHIIKYIITIFFLIWEDLKVKRTSEKMINENMVSLLQEQNKIVKIVKIIRDLLLIWVPFLYQKYKVASKNNSK